MFFFLVKHVLPTIQIDSLTSKIILNPFKMISATSGEKLSLTSFFVNFLL
jgi:hypothetical protein